MGDGAWGTGAWGEGPWGGLTSGQLQLLSAVASRENAVQLVFSEPVYFSQLGDAADASQKKFYVVTPDPASLGMDGERPRAVSVVSVAVVDAPGFAAGQVLELTLDRPMTPSPSLYSVATSPLITSADGSDSVDPATISQQFTGCHKQLAVPTMTSPSPRASRDFANPQTASAATSAGNSLALLGVVAVDDSGDYAHEEGLVALKKRVLRRIMTTPGGFHHLGASYGVGLLGYGKRLASSSARQQLAVLTEAQVRQEPEVQAASATLVQDLRNPGLFRLIVLVRTRTGQSAKLDVPVSSGRSATFCGMGDLPSRLDILQIGRSYLLRFARKIEPTQVDVVGSDANVFVGSQSVVGDAVVKQLGYSVNRLLLDGASGDDLDRYAFDRFQETRKGASPAVTTIQVSRPTAAAGAGDVPVGTVVVSQSNVAYETTTAATFGSAAVTTTADVRASQAGKAGEVGAHTLTRFAQPQSLFDKSLVVDNENPGAGGEDVEDDDTFRNRVRNFWLSARRGVLAAIETGALTVPGVVSAQAIEALTGGAQPARVVNLYIADSSGVASQALARQVRTALDDFRAGGIAVLISTSIPLIVQVEVALAFAAGVDTVSLSTQVQAAIVSFVNSLPVNGTLYVADLQAVLSRFRGDGVLVNTQSASNPVASSIVAPVGDLVPPVGQTLRTTLGMVSVTAA